MILSPATWPSPSRESMALALRCLTCLLSRGEAHAEGDVVKGAHVVVGGCGCGQAISWKTFREIGGSLRQQASMKALRMRRWLLSAR